MTDSGPKIWEIDESTPEIEGLDRSGRPRPEYAASLGLLPAPLGRRSLATLIEVAVVVVLLLPLLLVALPAILTAAQTPENLQAELLGRSDLLLIIICTLASYVLVIAFIVVQLILHGRKGVTLGKALVGIRSVNVRTLARPKFWRGAIVRYLVLWGSFLIPLIGPLLVIALSPLFDPQRRGRGWADLAAGTWLVDARRGLNPYDEKRMRIARKTVASNLKDERSALPSLATPLSAGTQAAYIPTARSRGGVLGAPSGDATPASTPDPAVVSASVAASVPPAHSAIAGPSLATPDPVPTSQPASDLPASSPAAEWAPPTLLPSVQAARALQPVPDVQDAAAPETPAPAALVVTLVLDTGVTINVDGAGVLLGRAPTAAEGESGLVAVRVADPSMSISKTHLAVLRSGESIVVVDRGSTNGSSLTSGGTERILAPRERVQLTDGDTIRFGDRHAAVRIG